MKIPLAFPQCRPVERLRRLDALTAYRSRFGTSPCTCMGKDLGFEPYERSLLIHVESDVFFLVGCVPETSQTGYLPILPFDGHLVLEEYDIAKPFESISGNIVLDSESYSAACELVRTVLKLGDSVGMDRLKDKQRASRSGLAAPRGFTRLGP